MHPIDSGDHAPHSRRPMVCGPVSARQIDVLKASRDNRGNLADIPVHWTGAVASLVKADLLRIDVVGFCLTPAGARLLAKIEEADASGTG